MARRKSETVATPVAIGLFGDGMREPVAPESFNRSQSNPNFRFANLVGPGENSNDPHGFTAITPNGVAHDGGAGNNQERYSWDRNANGARWKGQDLDWSKHGGNRTGE